MEEEISAVDGARDGTSDQKCFVSKGMQIEFCKVCFLSHHVNCLSKRCKQTIVDEIERSSKKLNKKMKGTSEFTGVQKYAFYPEHSPDCSKNGQIKKADTQHSLWKCFEVWGILYTLDK